MKRILTVVFCLVILFGVIAAGSIPFSASSDRYLKGDADGDGEISSVDATVVQRSIAGIPADVDGDLAKRAAVTGNELTLLDATAIQRYLARFNNEYHIGEPGDPVIVFPTEDNQLPIIIKQ